MRVFCKLSLSRHPWRLCLEQGSCSNLFFYSFSAPIWHFGEAVYFLEERLYQTTVANLCPPFGENLGNFLLWKRVPVVKFVILLCGNEMLHYNISIFIIHKICIETNCKCKCTTHLLSAPNQVTQQARSFKSCRFAIKNDNRGKGIATINALWKY